MAHGTGYYWIRNWNADIDKQNYIAAFMSLYYYYYEQMSDCYEPTREKKDEYRVVIVKHGGSDDIDSGSVDKDTINKIWWNIKNRDLTFDQCKKYIKEIRK
jgi:hypothetical protein